MTRYRKKPVEVEAWQVGTEPVPDWVDDYEPCDDDPMFCAALMVNGFRCEIAYGDYIVKSGEFFTWASASSFEQTYEVVE